jgi:two-component sensor histidine kinase
MRSSAALFFLVVWSAATAQQDSLLRVLNSLPQDSSRLPVITELLRATVFNRPDSGLYFAQQYIAVAERAGIPLEIGKGHNFMGMCYSMKSDQEEALQHYITALGHFEQGTDPWYTAMAHNNIGSVHEKERRFDKASREYDLAMDLFRELGDTAWMSNVSNNKANILIEQHAYDSAAFYYEKADVLLTRTGQAHSASSIRMNLANTYGLLGDKEKALRTMRSALAIHPAGEDEVARGNLLIGLGRFQGVAGIRDSALINMREGLRISADAGSISNLAIGHMYLAEFFETEGRFDSALVHQRRMTALNDSMYNAENSSRVAEIQEKYESGKKDLLIAEHTATLEQRALTIKAVTISAVLLLVAALFAYRAYRTKRKNEEELAAKNAIIEGQLKEKELLLREIHHRVKNNLQTVSSLLSIQGRGITDERAKQAVNDGRLRVKSMALIHQDLYREGDLTGVRMKEYVEKLAKGLITSYAMMDRVELRTEVEDIDLDVDTAVPIGLVLNELITNALKYAWPDARNCMLEIALQRKGDALHVHVRDNGVGYDLSEPNAEGSGFGLNMIKTFASKLKAEWSIRNDGGTLVQLSIANFKLAH